MEALWEEERVLQQGVLSALLDVGSVGEHRKEKLGQIRVCIVDALHSLSNADATGQIDSEIQIEKGRLRRLEDGEAALEQATNSDSKASLYLQALISGERLRWLRRVCRGRFDSGVDRQIAIVETELRWIDAQARDLAHADTRQVEKGEQLEVAVRSFRHDLQRQSVRQWLDTEVPTDSGDHPAADVFSKSWERVLEYHELSSDLTITRYPYEGDLDGLEALREKNLARCRTALASSDDQSREAVVLEALERTESHVSSLLSEGDLLETHERIVKYQSASEAVDDFDRAIESDERPPKDCVAKDSPKRREFSREYDHLGWVGRYAVRSSQNAKIEARMESILGRRLSRGLENLVFCLILVLVTLVIVEWRLDTTGLLTPGWALAFQLLDLGICLFLLAEVYLRWWCAGWAPWFLRRHFFFDFLPALPYGFLLGPVWFLNHHVELSQLLWLESAHLLLLLRVFRVMRILRGIRVAATSLRIFRLVIFVIRGMDRAVQRFRGFLDRNILLFESYSADRSEQPLVRSLTQQEARRLRLCRELFREYSSEQRADLLSRHLVLLEFVIETQPPDSSKKIQRRPEDRDLHLQSVIAKLMSCDHLEVESTLNRREIERLARSLRWCDLPIIRWLPPFRYWVAASRQPNPCEAVAEAARELGQFLQRVLSIFYLSGDLSGITTAPQVLDRVASAMIRATQRPAVRLILIGGVAFLISLFFGKVGSGVLGEIVEGALAVPFLVLGFLCLAINVLGRWLKRISGEALDTYLRTSEAHFFHLVKDIKSRRFHDDVSDLVRRVIASETRVRRFAPEHLDTATEYLKRKITTLGRTSVSELVSRPIVDRMFADFLYREMELVSLLYRDYLDGTLLERTDDKTSIQLLGNLAVRDIRFSMLRMGKKDLRRLEKLALEKDRVVGFGPYLWFRFISESLAIETAKLVMEYNSHCVPLRRMPQTHVDVRERYGRFLERKRTIADNFARRRRRSRAREDEGVMVTTEFHALHFLIEDEERDSRVGRIFGPEVHRAMIEDRRAMVREIFGTWPYHLLPRSARRLNPYRLYFRYLGGARLFLLPPLLLVKLSGGLWYLVGQLIRIVREVLGRQPPRVDGRPRRAGFDVAVRKINRMRKPYFMEAMRLRASVDVEYLGLRVPGVDSTSAMPTYREDLDFIGALEKERAPFEELRRVAIRDLRSLRLFLSSRGWLAKDFSECLLTLDEKGSYADHADEVLRALVSAFVTDQWGLRTMVIGSGQIARFIADVSDRDQAGVVIRGWQWFRQQVVVRWLPSSCSRRRIFERYARLDERLSHASGEFKTKVLRAFLDAPPEIVRFAEAATRLHESKELYDEEVLERLRKVAAEHALWSRKLLTLRMIQSLTVLDIRAYRELVWTLGGFELDETASVEKATTEVGRARA